MVGSPVTDIWIPALYISIPKMSIDLNLAFVLRDAVFLCDLCPLLAELRHCQLSASLCPP